MTAALLTERRGLSPIRLVVAALIVAGAFEVAWQRTVYRQLETVAAGWMSHVATASRDLVNRHTETFFLNAGSPKVFGVLVTPECSSAIVTAVVLAVTGLAVATGRFSPYRALSAAAVAAGGFAVLNLLRLVVISVATDRWGLRVGYHWSHVWAGTFVTVFGGVAAAVAYLMVLGGGRVTSATKSGREDS